MSAKSTSNQKTIAVIGATGLQGGGLVEAILADPKKEFKARAITRNAQGEKAQALAARGVEVVVADVNDLMSLRDAFKGCYGAFCMTSFWEHFDPELEYQQATNMALAAEQCELKHVVWSTLEDTRRLCPLKDKRMPTLNKKYKVPHFDMKGKANSEFVKAGVPTTFLHTSFYWENFITMMNPVDRADGTCVLELPLGVKQLPGISANDIGPCAFGCFQRPEATINRDIGIAGDHLTGSQLARGLSDCVGKHCTYIPIEANAYRQQGFPGAEDLGNMFQYMIDFSEEFIGLRDLDQSKALYPGIKNWTAFCEQHKGQVPTKAAN